MKFYRYYKKVLTKGVDFMYNAQETALRIKTIAKSKGIAIATLQQECGLGKNAINQLADSQEGMKSKNLYAIAEYLNVSVDYLLGRTPDKTGFKDESFENHVKGDIHGDIGYNINKSEDTTANELVKVFKNLSFGDKAKVMNLVAELSEKKGA
jgi:transcriptional regulator with XRE-family HTH domain